MDTIDRYVLAQWRIEAEAKPSGQRCNGIHDATPDHRVIVLLDLLETADKELLSSRERLAETEDELVRLGSFMYEANEKLAAVEALIAEVDAENPTATAVWLEPLRAIIAEGGDRP